MLEANTSQNITDSFTEDAQHASTGSIKQQNAAHNVSTESQKPQKRTLKGLIKGKIDSVSTPAVKQNDSLKQKIIPELPLNGLEKVD